MSYKLLITYSLLLILSSNSIVSQQLLGTIPEILYVNLSECNAGLLRDIYIKDSLTPDSCGPGGGIHVTRCSCSFDETDNTYKWRLTRDVIEAGSSVGPPITTLLASNVLLSDPLNYYVSTNVEAGFAEISEHFQNLPTPVDSFTELMDVGNLGDNNLLLWSNSFVLSYSGFDTSTNNFSISPTISTIDICLENGINCPTQIVNLFDLNDVDVSALNNSFLYYDEVEEKWKNRLLLLSDMPSISISDLEDLNVTNLDNSFLYFNELTGNWENRILVIDDIPILPLTKLETTSSVQFPYFNEFGILTSTECPTNSVLRSNGSLIDPSCFEIITEDGYKIKNLNEPPIESGIKAYYDLDKEELCVKNSTGWVGTFTNTLCLIIEYTLTINKAGTGNGLITSTPSGINCGITCFNEFLENTIVTLNNTPNPGSQFNGYSGDVDCSDGIVTMTASKTCTANFSLIPVDGAATDWTGSMQSYWKLDELGGTRASLGTCGNICNVYEFPPAATITNSTIIKVYGLASAVIDSDPGNQRFACDTSTCTQLKGFNSGSTMGDFSIGVWVIPEVTTRNQIIMENFDGSTSGGGFKVYVGTGGSVSAELYTSSINNILLQYPSGCAANQWCHVAVTFDEDTDNITIGNQPSSKLYINGIQRASSTSLILGVVDPDAGKLFRLCGTSVNANKFDGYCDSAFTAKKVFNSNEICRICRSGVTGEGGVCNGIDLTQYVSQSQTCNSCVPSNCNAVAP